MALITLRGLVFFISRERIQQQFIYVVNCCIFATGNRAKYPCAQLIDKVIEVDWHAIEERMGGLEELPILACSEFLEPNRKPSRPFSR